MEKSWSIFEIVWAYNKAADVLHMEKTSRQGLSKRLNNAHCGFQPGDIIIFENQLQSLFVSTCMHGGENETIGIQYLFTLMAKKLGSNINFSDMAGGYKDFTHSSLSQSFDVIRKSIEVSMQIEATRHVIEKAQAIKEKREKEKREDEARMEEIRKMASQLHDMARLRELIADNTVA